MTIHFSHKPTYSVNSDTPVKPIGHIQNLIKHLGAETDAEAVAGGEDLYFLKDNQPQCVLLHYGSIALYRRGDGLVLYSQTAPFIMGLSSHSPAPEQMYIKTRENCIISSLPVREANALIQRHNLWKDLSYLLIFTTSCIYSHYARLTQRSSYDIIKFQLEELINEPDCVRLNTSTASYIQQRSFLSRSGIMRILSELRAGGYITMEKGILIAIKHLPPRY